MPTLHQLLDAHGTILVLDAASARVQVGWLDRNADTPPRWHASEAEAGIALFESIEALGVDVNTAGAFVFCEGPGSILGIRTAAAAIRAWCVVRARPVYAYRSLRLVAEALRLGDMAVIADARRERWHCYQTGDELRRLPAASLPPRRAMPQGFRSWSAVPPDVAAVPYDVGALFEAGASLDLLATTNAPDAFMHEQPSYVRWTPQIHRAPIAP